MSNVHCNALAGGTFFYPLNGVTYGGWYDFCNLPVVPSTTLTMTGSPTHPISFGDEATISFTSASLPGDVWLQVRAVGGTSYTVAPAIRLLTTAPSGNIVLADAIPLDFFFASDVVSLSLCSDASCLSAASFVSASAPVTVSLRMLVSNTGATFSPADALVMVQYSSIAYLPQDGVRSWSSPSVALLCPACAQMGRASAVSVISIASTGAQLFVLKRQDGAVVVAFRGTESVMDGVMNSGVPLTSYVGCQGCKLHSGFLAAFTSCVPALSSALQAAIPAASRAATALYVTGHSLGGALATLASYELALSGYSVQGVFPIASPRVGNGYFAAAYSSLVGRGLRTGPLVASVGLGVLARQQLAGSNSTQPAWPTRPSLFLCEHVGFAAVEAGESDATFWSAWNAHITARERALSGGAAMERLLQGAGSMGGSLRGVWRIVHSTDGYCDPVTMVPFSPPCVLQELCPLPTRYTHIAPRVQCDDSRTPACSVFDGLLEVDENDCRTIPGTSSLHFLGPYAATISNGYGLNNLSQITYYGNLAQVPASSDSPSPTLTQTSSPSATPTSTPSATPTSTSTSTPRPTQSAVGTPASSPSNSPPAMATRGSTPASTPSSSADGMPAALAVAPADAPAAPNIGLSAGVPIGVALLALLGAGCFLMDRRRHARARRDSEHAVVAAVPVVVGGAAMRVAAMPVVVKGAAERQEGREPQAV